MANRLKNSIAVLLAVLLHCALAQVANAQGKGQLPVVKARIVATGIPAASAISGVGTFLPGGPIHDNPVFAAYTLPGEVLDPTRILVGSRSNFGAPLANDDDEGSFLSIDPNAAEPLAVPAGFAASDGQVSTLGGLVQMFSANSPAFLNGNNNPGAVTAGFTGVTNPLGLSINNAFGRLWPANAPAGLGGIGTSTILDPTGIPLTSAPNAMAGGVFAGNLTPRLPMQLLPGALDPGAVGTAFLGRSPDGSGRAVFSVVLADGSIIQAHTAKAVDGLAPAGTVAPLLGPGPKNQHGAPPRLGVVLNYEPARILYVTEPSEDSIAVIGLVDDGQIFGVAAVAHIDSRWLNQPVDLAPAAIETEDPNWSSNTTLEEDADFYVANRGDNTIVRMRQNGAVVAVRRVVLSDGRPLGSARLNGIAVSPDGSRIWVTVTGPGNHEGAVLETPAFEN